MDREYIIDLAGVEDRGELHERIAQSLSLPGWYGRNLDALYDVLTDPVFGNDCRICFKGCSGFESSMAGYFGTLWKLCEAACEEHSGLTIEFWD